MKPLHTMATLKSINVRKEGAEDEKQLAIDMKFEAVADMNYIEEISSTEDASAFFAPVFWDADGSVRLIRIENIDLNYTLKHANLTIEKRYKIENCSVKKFSFTPVDRFNSALTFTVSCATPPKELLPILSELLLTDVFITLEAMQEELF